MPRKTTTKTAANGAKVQTFKPEKLRVAQAKAKINMPPMHPAKALQFIENVLKSSEVARLGVETLKGTLTLY